MDWCQPDTYRSPLPTSSGWRAFPQSLWTWLQSHELFLPLLLCLASSFMSCRLHPPEGRDLYKQAEQGADNGLMNVISFHILRRYVWPEGGAGEMAWWVKCFPCNHEDLIQTPVSILSQGWSHKPVIPAVGKERVRIRHRRIVGDLWPSA